MKQPIYPGIAPEDDPDIEVTYLEEPSTSAGLWAEVKSITRDIIFAAVMAVLIVVFVVQPVKVEGTSMQPRLENDERIFVNKFEYTFSSIKRGDIIVFWFPDDPEKSYVKRVIGLPGETVELRNGRVFIDGNELQEPYLDTEHNQSMHDNSVTKVKEHYFFVMGDNRDNSSDSRIWGLVPEKYIYGKAFFRYWKPEDIGFLRHGQYNMSADENLDERPATSDER